MISVSEKRAISESLKAVAASLGIDKVGIAPAGPLDAEYARFLQWIEGGMNGEMEWLKREPEKRSDPRRIFPEAKSVIVAAVNYFSPFRHSSKTAAGKISRYAWGDDYHLVVKEKLERLIEWLKTEFPEIKARAFVDTAPLMEKPLAVRAGLGWIGKNANLITREFGSWVFLGVILTDLELDYDPAFGEDYCGTCRRCLDACPTGAITEPYVVDSRRCISYATIELRAEQLPPEIETHLDGWLYGCDVCQDVCPWNRFEKPTDEAVFWPREGETEIPPERIIDMTSDEYADRFRRSAIKRAKLTGLKRNARSLVRAKD